MTFIGQNIKYKMIPCLLSLLVFCVVAQLAASEHPGDHNTGHNSEHSNPVHEQATHLDKDTGDHGHTSAHSEHAKHETSQNEHGSGHSTEVAQGHDAEHSGGHKAAGGHGHDAHHAPPPLIYYINWGLILIGFIITCFYCLTVYKRGKPKHEGLGLAMLLIILVIVLYVTNQLPSVQRHFDPASHQFADGYHESSVIGFVKFIYKMALGICLTIYGIIGREDHH